MRRDRKKRISDILGVIDGEPWPVDDWGFSRVGAEYFYEVSPRYKRDIDWLEQNGFLEVDDFYVPGVRSKGYRLLEYPFGEPDDAPLGDPFLENTRDDLRRFTFPSDVSIESDKTCPEKASGDLARQERQVEYWRGKNRGNVRISDNGRMWTRLTSLSKRLRPQLLLDGEPVVEVDNKCCQPWMLAIASRDDELLAAVEADQFYCVLHADRDRAKEYFGRVFLTGSEYKGDSRGDRTGPRFWNDRPMTGRRREMAERFPDAWEWSVQVRLRGPGTSAKLQQMESRLVVQNVAPELLRRGIPMGTVHDCVVCKVSDAEEVAGLMKAESLRLFGRECRLGF